MSELFLKIKLYCLNMMEINRENFMIEQLIDCLFVNFKIIL